MSLTPRLDSIDNGGLAVNGTYTPTITNGANVAASTAFTCNWSRIGKMVIVSGLFNVDPTAATTATDLELTLPIDREVGSISYIGGAGASYVTTTTDVWRVYTSGLTKVIFRGYPTSASNQSVTFMFQYNLID